MKVKTAIMTTGFIWFGIVYSMIFTSLGTLLSSIA